MQKDIIRFLAGEPALIAKTGRGSRNESYLVIGDLHIGLEIALRDKGLHIYNFAKHMAEKVTKMLKAYKCSNLVIAGDVKESILYPEAAEAKEIKNFFGYIKDYNLIVTAGNHDAHLRELLPDTSIEKELLIGNCAILHGNMFPSTEAMQKSFIITAHSHAGVSMKDEKGIVYRYKAWLVSSVTSKAGEYYKRYNKKARLISMPAFNELITGTNVERLKQKENLNPLLRNGVFDYENALVYLLNGELAGTVKDLNKKSGIGTQANGD